MINANDITAGTWIVVDGHSRQVVETSRERRRVKLTLEDGRVLEVPAMRSFELC